MKPQVAVKGSAQFLLVVVEIQVELELNTDPKHTPLAPKSLTRVQQ